jgi:hypothetical protein
MTIRERISAVCRRQAVIAGAFTTSVVRDCVGVSRSTTYGMVPIAVSEGIYRLPGGITPGDLVSLTAGNGVCFPVTLSIVTA